MRRTPRDPTDLAYFRAYGPRETTPEELVRIAGRRWSVEEGFAQAKGEVGLDWISMKCDAGRPGTGTSRCACWPKPTWPPCVPRRGRRLLLWRQRGGKRPLMALSVPEVRRLLLVRAADADTRAFALGWSRFRRTHQAVAQRGHIARRERERYERPSPARPALWRPAVPPAGLTDAEGERVRPLLPPQQPAVGRRRHDHRAVLGGILWVLRSAAPWREMPARFGKANSVYVRYRLWREQGLWSQIIDALGPAAIPPARAGPP